MTQENCGQSPVWAVYERLRQEEADLWARLQQAREAESSAWDARQVAHERERAAWQAYWESGKQEPWLRACDCAVVASRRWRAASRRMLAAWEAYWAAMQRTGEAFEAARAASRRMAAEGVKLAA